MPIDAFKKRLKSSKKSEPYKYPTYVGDLPVKIIQDIIDNLANNDDWEIVAGKTGITARAMQTLKNKNQSKSELANIVFEQWLCRMPKPVDLANLLLSVHRLYDAKKLKHYICPEEWKMVEKKIRRLEFDVTQPPSSSQSSEVQDRLTSVEETTTAPPRQMAISRSEGLSSSASSVTSRTTARRPVNEPPPQGTPTANSNAMMELNPNAEVKAPLAMNQPLSLLPQNASELQSFREAHNNLMLFSPSFQLVSELELEPLSEKYPHIYLFNDRWIAKNFFQKETTLSVCRNFTREVTALLRLRHPNIIPLSGYLDGLDDFLLVYPFMSKCNLEDQLLCHKSFNTTQRLSVMTKIADALMYIHNGGFIHGDLSMTNILLDEDMRPYLADFEHSVDFRFGFDFNPNVVECTEPYFPPGGFVDIDSSLAPRIDIYAFGILFTLVFNQRIWKRGQERGLELVNEVFHSGRPTPNLERAHQNLHRLCLHCVNFQADSMSEIVEQLLEAQTSTMEGMPRFSENISKGEPNITCVSVNELDSQEGATSFDSYDL